MSASLRLYSKGLSTVSVNETIGRLCQEHKDGVKLLILSENEITSFPEQILSFLNLEVLLLDSNQLTSVPKELDQLTKLKKLCLHGNALSSLPSSLKNLEHLAV
jgi:Leucine-rich repeat (LRR) protein